MATELQVLLAHSYFIGHDAKQERKMRPYAPLATLIAAAILREQGHRVHFFDAMFARGVGEYRETLERTQPSVVAILEDNFNFVTKMCTTQMRETALDMIRLARDAGCFVLVNGPDSNDVPELYIEAGANAVIAGETEVTLAKVLETYQAGESLDGVRGLHVAADGLDDGTIRYTDSRPFVEDLGTLPLPAWDLVDVESYRRAWTTAHGKFSWNMVTTRGCPYRCCWCAKPLYGRRYAQRAPEEVAAEMAQLVERVGPDHVWFADDIFGLTPGWIEAFARAVKGRQIKIRFTIQSRPDLMTSSACAALALAGCEEVWLGVESGSQKVLDAMDKDITIADIRAATQRLDCHGIRPSWFLQLGFPGEDWPQILTTRDLIREETPHDVGVSVSYPLPGTLFHEHVAAELTEKTNWAHSDDLAMLFQGSFSTGFYRKVRDLLHDEAQVAARLNRGDSGNRRAQLDREWLELEKNLDGFRSANPTVLPVHTRRS